MKTKRETPKNAKIAALTIERWKLSDLKPHPRNPRKHPEPGSAEWVALAASLAADYFDPLVLNVRNGKLVSGHLRLKVMKANGIEFADVVTVDYDEPTHYARLMAANKAIGANDDGLMAKLFAEMQGASLAFNLAGFTQEEVDAVLARASNQHDREFLGGLSSQQGIDPEAAQPGTRSARGPKETFPLVVVFDEMQHAKAIATIKAAKGFFKTSELAETILQIFKHFDDTATKENR